MGNEQPNVKAPKPLNATELQTYLMVTQVKLNQGRNKRIALIKKKREEIIKHLNDNNLDIAKAKMESLMREEDYITVFDILGPLCEILKEKVTYIMTSKECPLDLRASLDTLIYSSTRLEIEELHMIREFMKSKFTNIYVDKANSNIDKLANINVVDKLTVKPYPVPELISRLKDICESENIQFSFPQIANPLIVDLNLINKTVIPTIPNFSNLGDPGQSQNLNYPQGNINNMNIPNSNFPNMPGYVTPNMGNVFPQQGNLNYPQGQYSMYNNMQNMNNPYTQNMNNPNMQNMNNSNMQNMNNSNMQNMNNPNMQNMNNPNINPYEQSPGMSFNTFPNNFSQIPNENNPKQQNQSGMNFPSNLGNNVFIPPINTNQPGSNNSSSNSGFPSMPNPNNIYQNNHENTMMMSGGFPPMTRNTNVSNTFPQAKIEQDGNFDSGFPQMGKINDSKVNISQQFPINNTPNLGNMDDLEFPSIDGFPKKKN